MQPRFESLCWREIPETLENLSVENENENACKKISRSQVFYAIDDLENFVQVTGV